MSRAHHRLKLTNARKKMVSGRMGARVRSQCWFGVLSADGVHITLFAALWAAHGRVRLELGSTLVTSILHEGSPLSSAYPLLTFMSDA